MQFSRQPITTKSQVLYTFIPYSYPINVAKSNLVFLKIYNTELDDITIEFIDKNGRPWETLDKVKLTLLVIK